MTRRGWRPARRIDHDAREDAALWRRRLERVRVWRTLQHVARFAGHDGWGDR